MVEALTRWPSLSSSPWLRWYTQLVFSAASRPDQRGDLCIDRRPACAVRIGPFPSDQAAVPPQDGSRGDQAVCAQLARQVTNECCHDGSVGPVEPGPGIGTAQHGDFMPQDEQLRVLGC
jgi:hypothetical protein